MGAGGRGGSGRRGQLRRGPQRTGVASRPCPQKAHDTAARGGPTPPGVPPSSQRLPSRGNPAFGRGGPRPCGLLPCPRPPVLRSELPAGKCPQRGAGAALSASPCQGRQHCDSQVTGPTGQWAAGRVRGERGRSVLPPCADPPCPRVPCRCPHQPNRRGAEASTDPSATGCRSPGGVVRTSLLCLTRTRSRGEGGPASQAGQGPPRWWGGQLSQTALAIPADWLCGSSLGRGRGRGRKTWAPASSTDPEDPTTLFLEGSVAPRRPRGP